MVGGLNFVVLCFCLFFFFLFSSSYLLIYHFRSGLLVLLFLTLRYVRCIYAMVVDYCFLDRHHN